MIETKEFMDNLSQWLDTCLSGKGINLRLYEEYDVKWGFRDKNGNGVVAGPAKVSKIEANKAMDGIKVPCEGKLFYRGYNIYDLISGAVRENRHGFEQIAYLLLFGELPNAGQFVKFKENLTFSRTLPINLICGVVMRASTKDVMIPLNKSILALALYDEKAWDITAPNVLGQRMILISVMSMLAVYGYHVHNHYERDGSMYIHCPDESLSTAENLLRFLKSDMKYSRVEVHVLDSVLTLHMEHDGGNNSTLTIHVTTSSGIDTHSVISATLVSLKGPKYGGADVKVVKMIQGLRSGVKDAIDRDEVEPYLEKPLHKEAFDHRGLIYGVGYTVYSKSDPCAEVFKCFARQLSEEKGRMEEFVLYFMIEELGPKIITEGRRIYRGVSASVDFYSELVYSMLDTPEEMFASIFITARIVGRGAYCAEELINMDKTIRPTYTSITKEESYKPLYDQ